MASCELFSCSCNKDTCPSSVVSAAINWVISGTVGGSRLVRRLNVTPVSGVAGASLAAFAGDAVPSVGDRTATGCGDGVTGTPGGGVPAGAAPSPFIERALNSLLLAAGIDSSSCTL